MSDPDYRNTDEGMRREPTQADEALTLVGMISAIFGGMLLFAFLGWISDLYDERKAKRKGGDDETDL